MAMIAFVLWINSIKPMKQNYERKNANIHAAFQELKRKSPARLQQRLNLSWSNWGFGIEPLADSAVRLAKHGVAFIELHGNHYGPDLGYQPKETLKILGDHGVKVAGICGMFSPDNDLSSNRAIQRQAAIDYIRRELDFARAVKAGYILVVPGAVGRPLNVRGASCWTISAPICAPVCLRKPSLGLCMPRPVSPVAFRSPCPQGRSPLSCLCCWVTAIHPSHPRHLSRRAARFAARR